MAAAQAQSPFPKDWLTTTPSTPEAFPYLGDAQMKQVPSGESTRADPFPKDWLTAAPTTPETFPYDRSK
jgi:hypothetical protein